MSVNQAIQQFGLAYVVLCGSADLGHAEEGAQKANVRAFVEARCGAQLVAYESGRKTGTSIFEPDRTSWDGSLPATSANLAVGAWGSLTFSAAYDLEGARRTRMPEGRAEVAADMAATLALADCLAPSAAERQAVLDEKGPMDSISSRRSFQIMTCLHDRLRQAQAAMDSSKDDATLDALLDHLLDANSVENLKCVEREE
ncbi:MAG: hypothetical protein NTW20_01395 [Rhodobacterales bacterium]|nr:hypothetical protein [Rhodobacterales bacterium]